MTQRFELILAQQGPDSLFCLRGAFVMFVAVAVGSLYGAYKLGVARGKKDVRAMYFERSKGVPVIQPKDDDDSARISN